MLKDDHTGYFTIDLKKAGPITVANSEVLVKLFVQPGDRLTLQFNPDRKDSTFTIRGNNHEGQHLLNKRAQFYEYEASSYLGKDSLIAQAAAKLKAEKEQEINVFTQLSDEKKITKIFFEFAILNLDYQYAALQASLGVASYYRTTLPLTHPKYIAHFAKENAAIWEQTYEQYSLSNLDALSTFFYFDYAYDYVRNYIGNYLAKKTGIYPLQPTTVLQNRYNAFDQHFKPGKVEEYLLANFLFEEANQKKYQKELVELYERFYKQYSESPYSRFIKPQIEQILAFNKARQQSFASDQKVIEHYQQIDSFQELLKPFKGKVVFVDLWASWCGPCIKEFEYGADLKTFLKEKNVEQLYISMDEDKADEKWKTLIRHHNLSGYHLRTNEKLRYQLIHLLWEGKGYSIPRYLIINKSGKIVEMNAFNPSAKERLYEQINKYL